MSLTVIEGGRVIDPANNRDGEFDLMIEDGKIAAVDKPGSFKEKKEAQRVSAKGLVVTPGLIDIHVHLREPGFEWKETVETGGRAAVAGGFTAVCCMPNTKPVNDSAQVTRYILDRAEAAKLARVFPIGAISLGLKGETLAPMLELREAGCVAFSDDGFPVDSSQLMRKALEYSLICDTVLTVHEEDRALSAGFSMNEGSTSLRLGLKGMPGAAEDIMIARDIELSRLTGAPVHLCHVSTARAVTLIRRAKEDGIRVTAETAPHYFTLDESAIGEFNTNAKMSMPLRTKEDVAALADGVASGIIDVIASDHAPHDRDSKEKEFAEATFGILGLQTTLPLTLAQVRAGKIPMKRAIEALTVRAAQCLRLKAGNMPLGTLSQGTPADVTLIDLDGEEVVTEEMIRSKSKNSPFLGVTMKGIARATFVNGEQKFARASE